MNYFYIAKITIEMRSALKIGSGFSSGNSDSPIDVDANNLPIIRGSGIKGAIKSSEKIINLFENEKFNNLFGYSEKDSAKAGELTFGSARILDEKGKACEGLIVDKSDFVKKLEIKRERQRNSMSDKRAVKKSAKFDEEIVMKGSRFQFFLTFETKNEDDATWENVLSIFYDKHLSFGAGRTRGFGFFNIVSCEYKKFNPNKDEDLKNYLDFTYSLHDNLDEWNNFELESTETQNDKYENYTIELEPEFYYQFGAGFGDNRVDSIAKEEDIVIYSDKDAKIESYYMIPFSSIKGALSHRTAYKYNKLNKVFINEDDTDPDNIENNIGTNNAVKAIFGEEKDSALKKGAAGHIIGFDIYIDKDKVSVLKTDHNTISELEGGVVDSHLFSKSAISSDFVLEISVEKSALKEEEIKSAFELALKDLKSGYLLLGGKTSTGYGMFLEKAKND